MKLRHITLGFEKRLTDGAYGSELASAVLEAELDLGDDEDDAAVALMAQARTFVEAQLQQSRSFAVRSHVEPPERRCSRCGEVLPDHLRGERHTQCPRDQAAASPTALLEAMVAARGGPRELPPPAPDDGLELEELPF